MNQFSAKTSCTDSDYLVLDNHLDVDSNESALNSDGGDGSNVVEVIDKSDQFSCFKSVGGEISAAEQQSIDLDKGALEWNISHSAKNSSEDKNSESCNYASSFDYGTFSQAQSPISLLINHMLTGIHHYTEIVMENNDLKNSDVTSLLFSSNELSFPANENENDNGNEKARNMKNEKYLQKKKSKEEKMKMKQGRLKEKRSEYSARLKIRNTDAWNSMTEEQQKEQKINRKIHTQLCEDVSNG
jgi:hypothetical protein